MKKALVFSIILILATNLIGCGGTQVGDTDLVKNVAALEQNEYQLKRMNISYEKYEESMSEIVKEDYLNSSGEDVMFATNDKEYKKIDLKDLSEDERNSLKDEIDVVRKEVGLQDSDINIEISKVFHAGVYDWKYVFSKITEQGNDLKQTTEITTKRYTFENIDDTWKIINVDSSSIWYSDEDTKDKLLPNLKYQTFNDEEIEYGVSYDLSDEN